MLLPEYDEMARGMIWFIYRIIGEPYSTSPKQIYKPLGRMFGLSNIEMKKQRPDGHPGTEWENRVQWTRQKLIDSGFLDGSVHGIWQLTREGIDRAKRQEFSITEH
jgi:5-methylcytosine-specific restriction enzyme A